MMSPTGLSSRPLLVVTLMLACGQSITTLATATCVGPTTGGNANGANCVFPFQFQNSQNNNCRVGSISSTPWCATTANWDIDGLWGNCIISSTRLSSSGASLPCVFPFTYAGSTYNECQVSPQTNLLWCGVVPAVSTTDTTTWGYCQTEDIKYTTTSTGVGYGSGFELTKDTPYLALTGELWDVFFCSQSTTTVATPPCVAEGPTTGGNADGAPCQFPFMYRGLPYNACITTRNGGVLWCATVPNYDINKIWGNCGTCSQQTTTYTTPTLRNPTCQVPTTGGNADGAPCHFPFMYRGQSYDACITANNEGVLWCATVPIYDINKIWGNCGSGTCGQSTQSTMMMSTGTTPSTPMCQEPTTGGNAGGAPCNFPFIYQGLSYDACITAGNDGYLWCATVPNYDNNKRWGNCEMLTTGGNADGAPCYFPFTYMDQSYDACITTKNFGMLWCATVPNYDSDKTWGNCATCGQSTMMMSTRTTPSTPMCQVPTTGGNAGGAPCHFPFIYEGLSYDACITAGNDGYLWCATVPNYDNNKRWGNCEMLTAGGNADGAPCYFPFTYMDQSYDACITTKNFGVLWCATVPNYDSDKTWGNCARQC